MHVPIVSRRRLLPLALAIVIGGPGGAAAVGQVIVGAAPAAQADTTYNYLGTFSFPAAYGLRHRVYDWGCRGGTVPNLVFRWNCAGKGNLYLLGHASGVFNGLLDAYHAGRLRVGQLAYYTRQGVTSVYKVAWVRLVRAN